MTYYPPFKILTLFRHVPERLATSTDKATNRQIAKVSQSYKDSSGFEPSISVLHRALDEAVDAANAAPQHHLLELRADTAEKFYYMGWEHSLSTKSDDGDHYGCGKRLAKSFADSIRRGEVK